jgi:large conductance mechanosensitive channel
MSTQEKMLEELRKIREALEPKPSPPPAKPKGLWKELIDFLSKYKIMGLAVAFIMGVYLGNLVQALVRDLIMPIIGLLVPGLQDLASLQIPIAQQKFLVGDFLVYLITFIIVAFVIFLMVKVSKRWGIE